MKKKLIHYIRIPTARHWAMAIRVVASCIIIFVVFMLFSLSAKSNRLALQAKQLSEQNTAQRQAGQARLENDMACIGTFFSLENRQFYKITDLRSCTIMNIADGTSTKLLPDFGTSSGTSSTLTPTPSTPTNTQPNDTTNTQPKNTTAPVQQQKSFIQKTTDPVLNLLKKL